MPIAEAEAIETTIPTGTGISKLDRKNGKRRQSVTDRLHEGRSPLYSALNS
jgi:hypothetical protein